MPERTEPESPSFSCGRNPEREGKTKMSLLESICIKLIKITVILTVKIIVSTILAAFCLILIYSLIAPVKDLEIPFSFIYDPCDPIITQREPNIVLCSFPKINVSLAGYRVSQDHLAFVDLKGFYHKEEAQMVLMCIKTFAVEEVNEVCKSTVIEPAESTKLATHIRFEFGKLFSPISRNDKVEVTFKTSVFHVQTSTLELRSESGAIMAMLFNNSWPTWSALGAIGLLTACIFWPWVILDFLKTLKPSMPIPDIPDLQDAQDGSLDERISPNRF